MNSLVILPLKQQTWRNLYNIWRTISKLGNTFSLDPLICKAQLFDMLPGRPAFPRSSKICIASYNSYYFCC